MDEATATAAAPATALADGNQSNGDSGHDPPEASPSAAPSPSPAPQPSPALPPAGVSNCYVFKSRLQEYAQKVGLLTPVYETVKEGPSHEPVFKSTVVVNSVKYNSLPGFFNRKAAEQSAAEVALVEIYKSGQMTESMPTVHETGLCKNLLQEYAQKMNYAIPSYVCNKQPTGLNPYSCTVEIGGIQYIGAAARTRKEAEIKAARTALLAIQSASVTSSNGASQYTVLPGKKKEKEAPPEIPKQLKPKKPKFKKKSLKKRFPRKKDNRAVGAGTGTAQEEPATDMDADASRVPCTDAEGNKESEGQQHQLEGVNRDTNEQGPVIVKEEPATIVINDMQLSAMETNTNNFSQEVKHEEGSNNHNFTAQVSVGVEIISATLKVESV